ncbi:16S rRNA m(2)G 1207 methyltransferase [Knoellia remsis]|uniref:16S rRNA m(2)G 1207 methyltransferase n=1 Tax=Knoellia remsis TaxID=407159 RepID=A0A2T0V0J3_9MICO|nr:methyltransferase [Knoellia remsis]PRY63671.1 16S rRNA m(2)G 1207 methyltransferase [Knoellia remsis]
MTGSGRTDSGEHYFTAQPATRDERRPLTVRLAGRDVTVEVAPGIFSPGGLDKGTSVLLDEVPDPPPSGRFLDLGCGWGPLALTMGLLSEHADVLGVDVNERSVDLTNRNATALGLGHVRAATPDAVGDDAAYDLIWSNPPIRIGKPALHELLRTWLPRLAPGGEAWLVVQRNLGSDSLQKWIESDPSGPRMPCARLASSKGFRVLRVDQPA